MKIKIIKKAEVKKSDVSVCPWVIEDMASSKK